MYVHKRELCAFACTCRHVRAHTLVHLTCMHACIIVHTRYICAFCAYTNIHKHTCMCIHIYMRAKNSNEVALCITRLLFSQSGRFNFDPFLLIVVVSTLTLCFAQSSHFNFDLFCFKEAVLPGLAAVLVAISILTCYGHHRGLKHSDQQHIVAAQAPRQCCI